MDIQKEREAFEKLPEIKRRLDMKCVHFNGTWYATNPHMGNSFATASYLNGAWMAWQAKAQAVPAQLDVNSILHDIDCYFDNGLSNTERTANNLLQSIYEKLSGEVKAQEPAND